MVDEKRKHARHAAKVVVYYRSFSPNLLVPDEGEGLMENVSLGGLFLTTEDPLPIGTMVDLKFDLGEGNGKHGAVRARAVVKWNRARFEPKGMGLEFREFSHGQETLETWLQNLDP